MDPLVIRPGLVIAPAELDVSFARSGGPGGQHVNTTSTKVVLRWDLTRSATFTDEQKARLRTRIPPRFLTKDGDVVIMSEEHKSQLVNRQAALERLVEVLTAALVRPKVRRATKPGKGARARRRDSKERQSKKKDGRSRSSGGD
jgi:ribosome-associated protein